MSRSLPSDGQDFSFGDVLRRYREAAGLSLDGLVNALVDRVIGDEKAYSRDSLFDWENGACPRSDKPIHKLAPALAAHMKPPLPESEVRATLLAAWKRQRACLDSVPPTLVRTLGLSQEVAETLRQEMGAAMVAAWRFAHGDASAVSPEAQRRDVARQELLSTLRGVQRVEMGGYDRNLEDLAQSDRIDMIAVNFRGLGERFASPLRTALQRGAQVRVLLLDPHSTAYTQYSGKPGEKPYSLGALTREAVENIKALQREAQEQAARPGQDSPPASGTPGGALRYRYYARGPFYGCILTDTLAHYWPFVFHRHSDRVATYVIAADSEVGQMLREDFAGMWNGHSMEPARVERD